MRRHPSPLALLALIVFAASCGEDKDDTAPPEGDADTDSDADADADSDADADADADCDTDTNSRKPPPLCMASAVIVGNDDGDSFGAFVAGGGDLDADGFDDVVVWAAGTGGSGTMYVFDGPLPGMLTAAEAAGSLEDGSGFSTPDTAVIVGDTNNDGFDDLVVGEEDRARAELYLGPITGAMSYDEFDALVSWSSGHSFQVFDGGDVDGNGTGDFILDDEAKVFVMTTPLEGWAFATDEAHAVFEVPHAGEDEPCWKTQYHPHQHHPGTYERSGESAAVGDLDGDGLSEMIVTHGYVNEQWWEKDVSEPCEGYIGLAYLLQGPVSGTIDLASVEITLEGEEEEWLNGAAGPIGDADGDGLADFFVRGSSDHSTGHRSTIFVVSGPVTAGGFIGDLPNVTRIYSGHYYPFDVNGTGDVNGNGLDDLVTGIVDRDVDWEYGAAIMLAPFSGTRVIDDADYIYRGEGENSWAGSSVSSAGDVDADGLMDVLIGARNTLLDGEDRGKAYLFYGADL